MFERCDYCGRADGADYRDNCHGCGAPRRLVNGSGLVVPEGSRVTGNWRCGLVIVGHGGAGGVGGSCQIGGGESGSVWIDRSAVFR